MLAVIMNDLAKHLELKYIDTLPSPSLSLWIFSIVFLFSLHRGHIKTLSRIQTCSICYSYSIRIHFYIIYFADGKKEERIEKVWVRRIDSINFIFLNRKNDMENRNVTSLCVGYWIGALPLFSQNQCVLECQNFVDSVVIIPFDCVRIALYRFYAQDVELRE